VPAGAWTHVACVFDGANLKIYVDGSGSGCTSQPMTIDTSTQGGLDLGFALQGGLDDVHIYGAALSDADVCGLATGGTACKPAVCN
jgi:hypothetical protein